MYTNILQMHNSGINIVYKKASRKFTMQIQHRLLQTPPHINKCLPFKVNGKQVRVTRGHTTDMSTFK